MRLSFDATQVALSVTDDAVVCGVTNGSQYLIFQRATERCTEEWGVHLEYSDQLNSGYRCVASCRLGWRMLSIDLSAQLGSLEGVDGFDVPLSVDTESFERLASGLHQVFRGTGVLHVA
jgi:hypothetical protein